jgi:dTDP-4-dehydrorhamnose reductase
MQAWAAIVIANLAAAIGAFFVHLSHAADA